MTETVNLAQAKATLSELVRRAAAGETINIALRGTPMVQLGPLVSDRKPVDIDAWARVAERAGPQDEDAGTFVRRMRDADRY